MYTKGQIKRALANQKIAHVENEYGFRIVAYEKLPIVELNSKVVRINNEYSKVQFGAVFTVIKKASDGNYILKESMDEDGWNPVRFIPLSWLDSSNPKSNIPWL